MLGRIRFRLPRVLLPLLAAAGFSLAAGAVEAAGEDRIALAEAVVTVPRPAPGVDRATLASAGEGEIERLDPARLPRNRHILVSLAVVHASDGPVSCAITAMLRDRKTGAMLAVIEGRASAQGAGRTELRRAVLRAAVHTAVDQIPDALAAN